ncbi:MAG TPA: M48 family metallopeptidase [Pirellulales bacterium]|nr:M48 family metallopeptidase [Pirellulales bacterium]
MPSADEPGAAADAPGGHAAQTSETPAAASTAPLAAGEQTPAELAEARRYGHFQLAASLADKLLDVVFLALMAFFVARPLGAYLAGVNAHASVQLWLLFLITTAIHLAVSFPLSCYSGFWLEHRFGLSRLTLGGWLWRYTKVHLLSTLFGGLLLWALYAVIWTAGGWWWLVAAALFFVVSVVAGQLVPVIIMPLFYKIQPIENPELLDRMAGLAAGTGLSIAGVYRFDLSSDTAKANAMLAGLGRTRRVLMGDTLLSNFTPDEIEVIFAHEIGHHVFRHIRKMIAGGAVYGAVGFWLVDRLVMAWVHATDPAADYAHFPVDTLPLVMLVLTLFSLLLEPLQNAVSRHFERQSDRYALERTGRREAYISAFQKLARLNKDDPAPHWLEVFWLHSHPPIAERLAVAERK